MQQIHHFTKLAHECKSGLSRYLERIAKILQNRNVVKGYFVLSLSSEKNQQNLIKTK